MKTLTLGARSAHVNRMENRSRAAGPINSAEFRRIEGAPSMQRHRIYHASTVAADAEGAAPPRLRARKYLPSLTEQGAVSILTGAVGL